MSNQGFEDASEMDDLMMDDIETARNTTNMYHSLAMKFHTLVLYDMLQPGIPNI